jgi:hypothetical protein
MLAKTCPGRRRARPNQRSGSVRTTSVRRAGTIVIEPRRVWKARVWFNRAAQIMLEIARRLSAMARLGDTVAATASAPTATNKQRTRAKARRWTRNAGRRNVASTEESSEKIEAAATTIQSHGPFHISAHVFSIASTKSAMAPAQVTSVPCVGVLPRRGEPAGMPRVPPPDCTFAVGVTIFATPRARMYLGTSSVGIIAGSL